MAKINKGMTLIELIIYINIYMIIFLMIIPSIFYAQKIIQNNNQNYYIKNQIYFNLNILQTYLFNSTIDIDEKGLNFYDKNHELIMTHFFDSKQLNNIYIDKKINITEGINIKDINIEIEKNNTLIKYEISWLDNYNKTHHISEYLIVINQNM